MPDRSNPGSDAPAARGTGRGLWLVRHAEVHERWRGKAYGDIDVELSAAGEARTEELARDLALLAPGRILASPLQRARRLGELAARHANVPLEVEPQLAEIHRGRWQGLAVADLDADEVRAFRLDPWRWKEHGGECDFDVAQRVVPILERLLDDPGQEVVVIAHLNVIRVVLALCLGVPPERSFALRIDPGATALLVDAPRGWQLSATNVLRPSSIAPELRPR
ncbi:MAG: histidine phosphatase family protein [Planctomycetota bacterium]